MQKQILDDIDKHLFPHLYGYGKENSTQTSLISMLEKWKLSIGAIRKVRTQVGERGGGVSPKAYSCIQVKGVQWSVST